MIVKSHRAKAVRKVLGRGSSLEGVKGSGDRRAAADAHPRKLVSALVLTSPLVVAGSTSVQDAFWRLCVQREELSVKLEGI